MKTLFFLFALIPTLALGSSFKSEPISSLTAVSQSGRFSVIYHTQLSIDKNESLKLTNFIAYQDFIAKKLIMIGAIPGEEDLSVVCKHPTFLKNENIADISVINDNDIQYFDINQHKGCVINITNDKSGIIIATPNPFVDQGGSKIKHIGIIGNKEDIYSIKSKVSFQITANEFFLNLLQLGQAFSPFSKEIDWDSIKDQGTQFIGNETEPCRGLSAAAKFLIPAVNKKDLHSFITLKGLDTPICPAAPIPENEDIKKWLAVPEVTRSAIIKYSSDFHGHELNKHIAYLYIPAIEAYDPDTVNNKIKKGREALKMANIDKSCGLIVDLRFNLGGNLQAMLLTLGGVIPDGKIFNLGKNTPIYLSNDGNKLFINPSHDFYGQYDGEIPSKNRDKPIAILTNWMTASSGELTRLALGDNSSQVRIFGSETSPTASVNTTFYLLDGNTFNLMVDRVYHNNEQEVPLRLPVDTPIEDKLQTIFDLKTDMTINAAKEWLESLPVCHIK